MSTLPQLQATPTVLSFDELLRHNEEETTRWHRWFQQNPAALDVALDVADMKDVRGMLLHIFVVEVLYTERITGYERPRFSLDDFASRTVDELFSHGAEARRRFSEMLAAQPASWWNETVEFSSKARNLRIAGTRRKMFAHALLHSMRHWAQLATALRQAGYKQDWMHDFIFTNAVA